MMFLLCYVKSLNFTLRKSHFRSHALHSHFTNHASHITLRFTNHTSLITVRIFLREVVTGNVQSNIQEQRVY